MEMAPLPSDEADRLRTLRQLKILDTPPERHFDDLTALAARLCDVPIALVSLVDTDRQWFKSRIGLDVEQTPRDIAFCAHTILDPEATMVVPDARQDPRFADNPLVTDSPHIRFYAGTPLTVDGEHAVGSLCVIDDRERDIGQMDLAGLRTLARQLTLLLEHRRQNVALLRGELEKSRHQARELRTELETLRAFRRQIEQVSTEGIAVYDCVEAGSDLCFSGWNPRMAEITGYSINEINAIGWFESVCAGRGHRQGESSLPARVSAGEPLHLEHTVIVDAKGRVRKVELSTARLSPGPGATRWLMVINDRSEQLRLEEQVRIGRIDALTGVRNRRAFIEDAERTLSARDTHSAPMALGYLDLDDLKHLNDRGGHAAGDRALQCVGATLAALTRSTDVIGRIGGDEFAVLLPATDAGHARRVFTTLHRAIGAELGELDPSTGVTAGVVLYDRFERTLADALEDADRVMYAAKGDEKGTLRIRDFDRPPQAPTGG